MELSLSKLQEIRKSKNLTYKKIAELTGISKSTITKIFCGFNKNPTLSHLKMIAQIFECSLDDFFEWEKEPVSPYYLDRKTGEIAQEIFESPDLRILFDASRKLTPEEMQIVINVANGLKKNH